MPAAPLSSLYPPPVCSDSQTGSAPACSAPQVPPTPTSNPAIRRSSNDPSSDRPLTEVEPFSLGANAAFLLPSLSENVWGSPRGQKSRGRTGGSLPALFESIGIETSGWDQWPSSAPASETGKNATNVRLFTVHAERVKSMLTGGNSP